MKKKQRVDVLLLERGLADSRSKAQALIMAGQVFSDQQRVDKPGTQLDVSAPLRIKQSARFVSRGGEKLEHGLSHFSQQGLDVAGKNCLDIGAATGGFTDCLLQRDAARVCAVDVGYGQLHPRLRNDARVAVRERTNARYLSSADFDEPIQLIVVDASFIGIGKLMPAITAILPSGGELVVLIKPQFEAGKEIASKTKGVIRDQQLRRTAIQNARDEISAGGFEIISGIDSPLRGPKGNLEYLVFARRIATEPPLATE